MLRLVRSRTRQLIPFACLWTIPLILAVEYANHRRPRLVGIQWTTTLDVVNGVYVLLAPLAAGVAAVGYSSVIRQQEMIRPLPDGGLRALAGPVLATAGVFSIVHLAFLAGVFVADLSRGVPGAPNPAPTVVVLAAFVAASGFGALLSRLGSGSLLAAPLAMLVVYGYEVLERQVASRLFSDFGGASLLLIGLRQRMEVVTAQAVWLGLLGVLLIAVSVYGWRASSRLLAGVALWTAMAGATLWLGSSGDTRFEEASVTWVCAGDTPSVCVTREYEDELNYFAPRVSGYADELTALGLPHVPSEFRQIVGADRPEGGYFGLDHQLPALAFKVLESSLPCSRDWNPPPFGKIDTVVAYLSYGAGGQVSPDQKPVTRSAAKAALDEIDCRP